MAIFYLRFSMGNSDAKPKIARKRPTGRPAIDLSVPPLLHVVTVDTGAS